jgi:hypothetical protein
MASASSAVSSGQGQTTQLQVVTCVVCKALIPKPDPALQCRFCLASPTYCSVVCKTKDVVNHASKMRCPSYALAVKSAGAMGNGVFSVEHHRPFDLITTERMWMGVIYTSKEQINAGAALTYFIVRKYRDKAVLALRNAGFSQQRGVLDAASLEDVKTIVSQLNGTEPKTSTTQVTYELVKEAFAIVLQYELHLSNFGSKEDNGPTLFRFCCLINHSCNPNAIVFPVKDAVHLVALRDIAAGEEVTITYRDMMGIDSHRDVARVTLYKHLFNEALCRCGDALCVHKGLKSVPSAKEPNKTAEFERLDQDMAWCEPFQDTFVHHQDEEQNEEESAERRLVKAIHSELNIVLKKKKEKDNSGSSSSSSSSPAAAATDADDKKINPKTLLLHDLPTPKSIESRLTQLLMLCRMAMYHQIPTHEGERRLDVLVRASGYTHASVMKIIEVSLKHARPVLKESELALASFEYELFSAAAGHALVFQHVPIKHLRAWMFI